MAAANPAAFLRLSKKELVSIILSQNQQAKDLDNFEGERIRDLEAERDALEIAHDAWRRLAEDYVDRIADSKAERDALKSDLKIAQDNAKQLNDWWHHAETRVAELEHVLQMHGGSVISCPTCFPKHWPGEAREREESK